jgi:hypothetical protein
MLGDQRTRHHNVAPMLKLARVVITHTAGTFVWTHGLGRIDFMTVGERAIAIANLLVEVRMISIGTEIFQRAFVR